MKNENELRSAGTEAKVFAADLEGRPHMKLFWHKILWADPPRPRIIEINEDI